MATLTCTAILLRLRQRLEDENASLPYFTDTRLIQWANDTALEIANIIPVEHLHELVLSETISFASTGVIILPTTNAFLRFVGLNVRYHATAGDDLNMRAVALKSMAEVGYAATKELLTPTKRFPLAYLSGLNIYVTPSPVGTDASGSALYFIKEPSELTSTGSSTTGLGERHITALVEGTAYRATSSRAETAEEAKVFSDTYRMALGQFAPKEGVKQ